ncbi:MAG TPA: rhamnan synthesis F family protein [Microbacteriaceae bacterium]|nr:rhamnan synthesis F family protein [Microbacteriaceae bacterium]
MESDTAAPPDAKRLVIYAVSATARLDGFVLHALSALRPFATRVVVVRPAVMSADDHARLAAHADDVLASTLSAFSPQMYAQALARLGDGISAFDEVILSGDAWFGPIRDFAPVLDRMRDRHWDFWEMTENSGDLPESFPAEGFPARTEPWAWTVARRSLFLSESWQRYWASPQSDEGAITQEHDFARHFRGLAFVGATAFNAPDFSTTNPALFVPELLIAAGCPILRREPFTLYPPYLDRHAVIGREILAEIAPHEYPESLILENLAKTVAPKALNANLGMLEVLPDEKIAGTEEKPPRIAVIAHVTDLSGIDDLVSHVANLPDGYDLIATTTDGKKAARIQDALESRAPRGVSRFEVRVTPALGGRDMSDFFVGCRDVLLSGEYDLTVKVHVRRMRKKTANARRYFRRYQFENLLDSPGYVANLLALFAKEPGLGLVFPPMMHIGYGTMGGGWASYAAPARRLFERLRITVPLDEISPLAPYGGMWIGRPEALRLLSNEGWKYREYGAAGAARFGDLARLQERTVVYAAGALGYHARTVMTAEHAAISHSAIDFKVDQLFSTTRGYPVEQIQLLHRAGDTGYGGAFGLSRMYLSLNHPGLARVVLPLYGISKRAFYVVAAVRRRVRRIGRRVLNLVKGRSE